VYAMLGGIFGTISILSMVVIGYDRYNVICKGFNGVKITAGKVIFVTYMKVFDYKVKRNSVGFRIDSVPVVVQYCSVCSTILWLGWVCNRRNIDNL